MLDLVTLYVHEGSFIPKVDIVETIALSSRQLTWLIAMLNLSWSRSWNEEPIFKFKIYQVFFLHFHQHASYPWIVDQDIQNT